MTRRPRHLSAEEKELWDRVRRQATPLKRTPTAPPPDDAPAPGRFDAPAPRTETRLPSFRLGEARRDPPPAHDLVPRLSDDLAARPLRMDRKKNVKLKRGKLEPEARLDLHGMTLDRAHAVLNRFILDVHAQGRRLVLVITGKGKSGDDAGPIPVRRGQLKHQVPQWLGAPALGHAVLQVEQAHRRHGGSGAYYVYLRRQR